MTTMTSPEILQKLQPLFRDVLDNPSLNVGVEDSALTVEGWDSLAHINLVTSIEQEFRIRFALGELQELKNVGDMIELMSQKLEHPG
jgi:acyl carrier protein